MGFVILGVLLLALHFAGLGPPALWDFEVAGDLWKFVAPFVAALVWWGWSDASGRTRRQVMAQEREKVDERRRKQIVTLKPPQSK